MNFRKSVFLKKLVRYSVDVFRPSLQLFFSESDFLGHPPVIVNSFPKSGTHLLMQIVSVLPSVRDLAGFYASTPSFTYTEIDPIKMSRRIESIIPGETAGGHVFYSPEVEASIEKIRAVHYFIYRDPRDVALSDVYYLSEMNRWHRLYRYFSSEPSFERRIDMSLDGFFDEKSGFKYESIKERFDRYKGWIGRENVLSVRYEDLMSSNRRHEIERIVQHYADAYPGEMDVNEYVDKAISTIDPNKSHTFRSGKTGQWHEKFSGRQKENVARMFDGELSRFGYTD